MKRYVESYDGEVKEYENVGHVIKAGDTFDRCRNPAHSPLVEVTSASTRWVKLEITPGTGIFDVSDINALIQILKFIQRSLQEL